MSSPATCAIALPENFRVGDVLAFHGRDTQAVAERIEGPRLQKGLLWHGRPASLSIRFEGRRAAVELGGDSVTRADRKALEQMARRMLGLTQPVEAFERAFALHPQLGPLIARQSGMRVPLAATPFEALTWAITGQQISVAVAISMRRKLIRLCALQHSGGLACHPDAHTVAQLDEEALRGAGFSQAKARTLLALSREVAASRLPLETWLGELPVEEVRESLLRLRGIGPWTVNYALLRGFGWLDGSLHGDVAVRRKLQRLLGASASMSEADTQSWLVQFSPWRALVAAHLWALPAAAQAASP